MTQQAKPTAEMQKTDAHLAAPLESAVQGLDAASEEQAEAMAHDALVYELSVVLMRLDGNDGDPHQLVWCGGPVPEPWGDVWQKYEPQAEEVINAIGEGSAQAMVAAFGEREWVAQVVSSGPHNFPLLEWRSADVSLGTAIGTKLYLHPCGVALPRADEPKGGA
jgi:hypothetical protein